MPANWQWKELRVIPIFAGLIFFCHYGWAKLQFSEKTNPGGQRRTELLGYDFSYLDPRKKKNLPAPVDEEKTSEE